MKKKREETDSTKTEKGGGRWKRKKRQGEKGKNPKGDEAKEHLSSLRGSHH